MPPLPLWAVFHARSYCTCRPTVLKSVLVVVRRKVNFLLECNRA